MKKQRGIASYYLLFLVLAIIAGVVLVGGKGKFIPSTTDTNNVYYVQNDIVSSPPASSSPGASSSDAQKSLQLQTFTFRKVAPLASNCSAGALQGKNESDILWATIPGPGETVSAGGFIKAFYSDEWPMSLGKGAVSSLNGNPGHILNPVVGDETAKDVDGFTYYPAIFLTDITSDPTLTSGDAPNAGAVGHKPSEIYGTWQALGDSIGKSSCRDNSNQSFCNKLNTGGPDVWPSTSNLLSQSSPNEPNASAEIIWNVDSLGLTPQTPQHTYRVQLVVHDGDRAGDIGIACTTIKY